MSVESLAPRERALALALALLAMAAAFGPALPTPAALAAAFADGRAFSGLPNAMDVLSNLPFALVGFWGLARLRGIERAHQEAQALRWRALPEPHVDALDCAWLFFAGLLVTSVGSAFYHLQPDTMRLAADRAGMAVAFSGLIGFAVCERVSQRAGWPVAWFMLAAALVAVAVFHETGNVLPWGVLQFGGMALVVLLSLARPVPGAIGVNLFAVILAYGLAKLFELGDSAVYEATGHLISGHTVKHLTAACAALPVLQSLGRLTRQGVRHNSAAAAVTA